MKRLLLFIFILFGYLLILDEPALAYERFCSSDELYSNSGTYYVCDKQVYLNKDNRDNSSYILGDRGFKITKGKVLYAGKIDGYDTFYSTGFHYYSIVYDDGIFSSGEMYSDFTYEGVVVYSGKFEDNLLVNQSGRYLINYYNEPGEYFIRQYIGGKVTDFIKVIVVDKEDLDLEVKDVYYGGKDISLDGLLYSEDGKFWVRFGGGKYGYDKKVKVQINKCEFEKMFYPDLDIDESYFKDCLSLNGHNNMKIITYDGLGRTKEFSYKFKMNSSNIVISIEDSVSKLVTSSRRVIVKSSAGYGKKLDENYNLYYWSTSAGDKLTYADFMVNYELSGNKGVYSENNGVILRDSDGTYYLYALARDSFGNSEVVRSNEYVLKRHEPLNKATTGDVALVLILCLFAAAPIFIYLIIRGKDTD